MMDFPMPLRRNIFNTLTVVSLLLLLATVGLWCASPWKNIFITFTNSHRQYGLGTYTGGYLEIGFVTLTKTKIEMYKIPYGWKISVAGPLDVEQRKYDWACTPHYASCA